VKAINACLWRIANLRVLEVDEIEAIPCTPRSHAFVKRLIGTVRREYLDRTLFWNQSDLERKLENEKAYYNQHRCHSGLAGATPAQRSGVPHHQSQNLSHIPGGNIAKAYFRPHYRLN
jgi:transposase InsO family protein